MAITLLFKLEHKLWYANTCSFFLRVPNPQETPYFWGAMIISPPPARHCDSSTHTIRHCNDLTPVMLRPCDTMSAIRSDSGFFVQANFVDLNVTVTFHPAPAILIVTIRPAWRWDTTAACKDVRIRLPTLTRGMVDPTQQDTIDPCLGGALLGGSHHI